MDPFHGPASDKENYIPPNVANTGRELLCPVSTSSETFLQHSGNELLCPVSTLSSALLQSEQTELRAYKLGKQKCSYNQVELLMKDINGKELKVLEAVEATVGNEVDHLLKESCLKYNVRFVDNSRMYLYIYVVYATPYSSNTELSNKKDVRQYWVPVTRSKCKKECKGPVIRGLQRFGKMSRRVGNNHIMQPQCGSPNQTVINSSMESLWKEPRHLYIAIDEASTHVCPQPQKSKFRLLLAAYDDQHNLLGSTVSSPVRVLANNDAPLGAACFKLYCNLTDMHNSDPAVTSQCRATPKLQRDRIPLRDIAATNLKINHATINTWKNSITSKSKSVTTMIDQKKVENISVHTEYDELERLPMLSEEIQTPSTSYTDENTETLEELCHRIFEACSLKQEGVITLRKFAIILGANRHSLLQVFCILEVLGIVQGQGKEKYIWLGSKHVENALQKIMIEEGEESSDTSLGDNLSKSDNLADLVRRFCRPFLRVAKNGLTVLKLEFVTATIIGKQTSPSYEQVEVMKATLWKISIVLSALNLITRKPGPSFQWMGSESVLAGLRPAGHPASPQCQGSTTKRKREDMDALDRDKSENYLTTCARDKTKLRNNGNEAHINEMQENLSNTTSSGFHIHSRYREPLEITEQPACTETYLSIDNLRWKISTDRTVDVTKTDWSTEDRLSAAKNNHCSSAQQYNDFSSFHEQPNHSGTQRNLQCGNIAHCCRLHCPLTYPSPFLYCSCNDYRLPVEIGQSYSFDPLGYLQTFVSPEQFNFFQQYNPDFLLNFVRYYRQLYYRISRAFNHIPGDIIYPSPSRPSYPFYVNHQNFK